MIETTVDNIDIQDFRLDTNVKTAGYFGKHRTWSEIHGVTLHQSGGPGIYVSTWRRLRAHIAVQRDGRILLLQDYTKIIWHAQGLSKATLGIEFEGNMCGLRGDKRTYWKPGGGPHELTAKQIEASKILFGLIHDDFVANGGEWSRVHGHRQSSDQRTADPGQAIWEEVAIPWMEALDPASDSYSEDVYGGSDYAIGTGKPIPKQWDPTAVHSYWD
jgi:hypothetical protein